MASTSTSSTSTAKNNNVTVDSVIASKVDQIKAQPYATNIVSEDVIERNFGYKIIRQQVSTGRNSMIYKCESIRYPDSYCLVKPYKLGKEKIKTVLREETCQIMRFVTAKCAQIISTYDLFYTSEKIYLMCDWSQRGEVLSCMRAKSVRLTEELLRTWTIDILNAIQFLQSNAICHRNIAPSCLLLTSDDHVKLGLLSDACIYCKPDGTLLKQRWAKFSRATNWNQAPEVAKSKPFDPRRADIWSIGATVYWFICRTYPIDYRSGQRLTKQMDYRLTFLKRVSRKCQAFVKKLLTFQPPLRPTIEQTLELEWITCSPSPRGTGGAGGSTSPVPSERSTSRSTQQQQPGSPSGGGTGGSPAAAAAAAAQASASHKGGRHYQASKVAQTDGAAGVSHELVPQAHNQVEPGEAVGPSESGAETVETTAQSTDPTIAHADQQQQQQQDSSPPE